MRVAALGVLVISAALLVVIVFRKNLGWGWLSLLGTHLILAAVALYLINFSGFLEGMYIPINPATIGTVTLLGLPGVLLLLGLKFTLIG